MREMIWKKVSLQAVPKNSKRWSWRDDARQTATRRRVTKTTCSLGVGPVIDTLVYCHFVVKSWYLSISYLFIYLQLQLLNAVTLLSRYRWLVGSWGECILQQASDVCGTGLQNRTILCVTTSGQYDLLCLSRVAAIYKDETLLIRRKDCFHCCFTHRKTNIT